MKQLAFFMNPSRLSWEIITWLSDQIFNVNHLIFTAYGISTLDCNGTRLCSLILAHKCPILLYRLMHSSYREIIMLCKNGNIHYLCDCRGGDGTLGSKCEVGVCGYIISTLSVFKVLGNLYGLGPRISNVLKTCTTTTNCMYILQYVAFAFSFKLLYNVSNLILRTQS